MRGDLQALRRAGLRSALFRGRLAGLSSRNFVILTELETPLGISADHIWLSRDEFCRMPPVGSLLEFVADIETYERASDGSEDLGLVNLRQIEVQA
ncbi:MAG: hypothetical protein A4E49_03159 [Methanosaeta sp. PtaU1.Bin112]|nr:MAG: hypothetical protein A4E49_03159 [Methanosaeta sp. PtaU1.Bin112]